MVESREAVFDEMVKLAELDRFVNLWNPNLNLKKTTSLNHQRKRVVALSVSCALRASALRRPDLPKIERESHELGRHNIESQHRVTKSAQVWVHSVNPSE